jgi:hypothetical protein
MITDDQSSAAITSAGRIGKVFMVVSHDVRRCLVCGEMFTKQAAAEHTNLACSPTNRTNRFTCDAKKTTV